MEKPLLSICIPTYNRCEYLMNTLNSIIYQKEFQDGMVEIVISDNASIDETEQVVKNYTSRFENIVYFRNPENIHDQNFPLALRRGTGLYRKLHSDTLLCISGSLRYICDIIKQYSGTEKILFMPNGRGKDLKEETIECTSFEQFVRKTGIWTGWIGAFGLWESETENITADYSGCEMKLWQCKRIYEMAAAKEGGIVINRMLFFNQEVSQKDLTYGVYQVLHLNFLSILHSYIEKGLITRETYENIRIDNLYRLSYFVTRGEQKRHQWNVPDAEATKTLVYNEAKEAGIGEAFQKHCKKEKWLYRVKAYVKIIFQKVYCPYVALRAHCVANKQA